MRDNDHNYTVNMKNGLTLVYLTNYINKYLKTKPSDTTRR